MALDYMVISMQYPGYYIVSAVSLQAKWMIITTAWQIHLTIFPSFAIYGMSADGRLFSAGMFGMIFSVPGFTQILPGLHLLTTLSQMICEPWLCVYICVCFVCVYVCVSYMCVCFRHKMFIGDLRTFWTSLPVKAAWTFPEREMKCSSTAGGTI